MNHLMQHSIRGIKIEPIDVLMDVIQVSDSFGMEGKAHQAIDF
jgi:hypothetical protein